ncbi:hypothetical protein TURU_065107 [Turdus rufiventris]|nr:hypothetical protein TURU_065107 [Turdus rufiventris]
MKQLQSRTGSAKMELSDANLQTLTEYLKKTLDPDPAIRRPAEKFLESVEGSQNYPLLLLTLLEKSQENVIKVCASVTFKNYIKRNWRIVGILVRTVLKINHLFKVEDEPNKICELDRIAIKANIVPLMLSSPEQIQKQLSDAISIIGREDFPQKWPDLLTEMVNRFQSGDFHVINGVLRTAHSLFKRYRHEFKSNELWTEIKLVLDAFALPLTNLFKATIELCSTHANDASALKVLFSSLILIAKLFYSLNFQDLPEFFEDNMETWMTNFHSLLTLDNKLLQTDLVSNAIQFLASVCERPHYKHLFEDQNTLTSICEKVIVPNMEFRAADEEAFEDNSEEYIRRDLEGSDIDTRRRAACDLVRGLCKFFEGPVTGIFSGYVNSMLQEYAKNPSVNWKHKDAAIYLVTSLASKAQTQKHGITQANELVNLTEFFVNHIQPDLKSATVNEFPVLKADGIKYIMIFRNQVPKEQLLVSIPLLINHLQAESIVVHTYAAHALERLFTMRGTNNATLITAAEMAPFVEVLLTNLFKALTLPGSSENEYIMKAIMRSFSLLQESIIPYIPSVITQLTQKLLAVSKNPSKPHFNHYMFESICLSIRITCKANPEAVGSFEEALFLVFTEILQNDVQEFIPYVFQVMSLLLEMHKNEIPSSYMALFPHLLQPVLWERTGNIPPLVRLLQAYLERGASTIASAAADKIPGLLGVFQKLIASKANDHQGFYLLNSIIEHMPPESVDQYRKQIFILLFQRLQNSKTTKFIKSFLVFINLYCVRYGALALQEIFDSIQPKMFGMVLEKIIIPEIQKVSGQVEKKICAVGITKILTECPPMMDTEYTKLWIPLLQALIGLFELPEDDTIPDEEHFIDIEDTPGYQTAFSQLAFAGRKEHDPVGQMVNNPRIHLAQSLHKLSTACPGRVLSMLSTSLNAEALQYLQGYLQAASVSSLASKIGVCLRSKLFAYSNLLWLEVNMSQVQIQNPSAALAGSQILNKNPSLSQPLSIPSTTSSLPSENAGRPIQNSALPSASVTSTSAAAAPSNMANPKEKTPMCLVNELARFNKIQPEYKLLSEQGPAHSKVFTVQLTLGDQHWEAEGTSIKKAQHAAAAKALEGTKFPKPTARPSRSEGKNPDSVTPTVELNALCMKLGKKPMYKPIDPYTGMRSTYNYTMRGGTYPPRYFYPFPVGPLLYQVELSIGGQQFHGKGRTRQAAKHDAAAKALKVLQNEPLPEKPEAEGVTLGTGVAGLAGSLHPLVCVGCFGQSEKCNLQSGESENLLDMESGCVLRKKENEELDKKVNGKEPDDENLNKSEISQVFEIALKRNLPVNFEVTKESGPPHMKSFVTKVSVGEFMGEGEGKSKKISKKNAAIAVLEELKKLPPLPTVEKMKPRIKKKTKSIVKLQTSPEYGQGMNPISRLAQIQQAKKEKEPEYMLITERGLPRRREFVMQVKVGVHTAEGMGTNKKVAKRNAAENMLEILGFKVPQPQPPKPALKTEEKTPVKKPGDGRKVTFFEPGSEETSASNKEDEFRMPYLSHQQLPAGILPMVPEVAQAVGANQGHHTKEFSRAAPNPAKATVTAMIARELLYGGTSPTAETILKSSSSSGHFPHGPLTRPSEQLDYLSNVQGIQVEYKDFPKNNKNEFVSLINCSSQPPLISHGIGKDVESCHDMSGVSQLKGYAGVKLIFSRNVERVQIIAMAGFGRKEKWSLSLR